MTVQNERPVIEAPPTSGPRVNVLQRKMFGHGALMILSTCVFGLFLWMKIVGGFELVPTVFWHFHIPGTEDGWAKAHIGPALNGMMVVAIAVALPVIGFPEKTANRLGWIVVLDGWSNVCFYFFSNFDNTRGLSFGSNKLGHTNIFGIIALGPAYLFGVLVIVALAIIGWRAIKGFPADEPDRMPPATVA